LVDIGGAKRLDGVSIARISHKENLMNRCFRLTTLLPLALAFVAAPAARAQTATPEMKQPPEARVQLYRVAPGRHLDFLKWMAEADAIDKEAGVPRPQLYAHTNGDSWDYMAVSPHLSREQEAKVDEIARKHGRKTGFAASLEFRTFVSSHTDTDTIGPVTATDLVAAAGK
jgi:hypothetical protein